MGPRHQKRLPPATLSFFMAQFLWCLQLHSLTVISPCFPPLSSLFSLSLFCPISWVHSEAEQASVSAPRSSGFIFPHRLLPASLPSSSSHLSGSSQLPQVTNMKLFRAQPQNPSLSWIPHSLKMKTPQGRTNYKSTLCTWLELSNYLLTD